MGHMTPGDATTEAHERRVVAFGNFRNVGTVSADADHSAIQPTESTGKSRRWYDDGAVSEVPTIRSKNPKIQPYKDIPTRKFGENVKYRGKSK